MMLSEDQIKRGILHPERDVRDAIVFYFAKSFSPDPTLMPLVIQAIEQYGWAEAFEGYSFLDDLIVQTDDAFCWLLNERKGVGVPQDEREEDYALGVVCRPDPGRSRPAEASPRRPDGDGRSGP